MVPLRRRCEPAARLWFECTTPRRGGRMHSGTSWTHRMRSSSAPCAPCCHAMWPAIFVAEGIMASTYASICPGLLLKIAVTTAAFFVACRARCHESSCRSIWTSSFSSGNWMSMGLTLPLFTQFAALSSALAIGFSRTACLRPRCPRTAACSSMTALRTTSFRRATRNRSLACNSIAAFSAASSQCSGRPR